MDLTRQSSMCGHALNRLSDYEGEKHGLYALGEW